MTYQKPDLFLVGAAQGLVLGAANGGIDVYPDGSRNAGDNCPDQDVVSRGNHIC
jgi:hypothetical protein